MLLAHKDWGCAGDCDCESVRAKELLKELAKALLLALAMWLGFVSVLVLLSTWV